MINKFFQKYADHQNVFITLLDIWEQTYKSSYDSMMSHIKGKGDYQIRCPTSPMQLTLSSAFDQALIITIDGGGRDYVDKSHVVTAFTAWEGMTTRYTPSEILKNSKVILGIHGGTLRRFWVITVCILKALKWEP